MVLSSAGSGRQVAQGAKAYKDRGAVRNQPDDKVSVKEEVRAANEGDALSRLASAGATAPHRWPLPQALNSCPAQAAATAVSPCVPKMHTASWAQGVCVTGLAAQWPSAEGTARCLFRLVEFRVTDEAGTLQPLELLGISDTTLFVSGEPLLQRLLDPDKSVHSTVHMWEVVQPTAYRYKCRIQNTALPTAACVSNHGWSLTRCNLRPSAMYGGRHTTTLDSMSASLRQVSSTPAQGSSPSSRASASPSLAR